MFWRFGGYSNVSTVDALLDKPDVTLEELLDESDLIAELKQHNSKLIEYLRNEKRLARLLQYTVAPSLLSSEDEESLANAPEPQKKKSSFSPVRGLSIGRSRDNDEKTELLERIREKEQEDKVRQKQAYVACEILSSETWSIIEATMEGKDHLKTFWDFLSRETPLDPVAASYFTKVNETLLDKKTEDMLDFIKSLDGIVPAMLTHVDCPVIMDLLLKIISLEKVEGGQGTVDWLQSQDLMPMLLGYLGPQHPSFTQTAAGDFIKAIITISANASQNEQSCIGPNSLTRQLVSETCIESLIGDMLHGGNPLTVGVGIIIEVIRKNNSDYDPDVGAGQDLPPTSNDPIYLGTLLRLFARHVPDFTSLILSPNHTVTSGDSTKSVKRDALKVAFGASIEPLGFDRFKTCELMAELLHCSNMGLLNERGSEAFVKQRDHERERLRAVGALPIIREPQSAITDFSEGSVDLQHPDASAIEDGEQAEVIRAQDVVGSAEDDGFEDVGTSAQLAEDMKDDFDEKNTYELEANEMSTPERVSPLKPSKPRLDLDEEFVDEPLTSPRLEAVDEKETEIFEHPETLTAQDVRSEASETDLSVAIEDLSINQNELSIPSTSEPVITASPESTIESDKPLETKVTNASSEAPPLPLRNKNLDPPAQATEQEESRASPHPEDKPPPLFAEKAVSPVKESHDGEQAANQTSDEQNQDTFDITLGDEGDRGESVLLGHDQGFAPFIENDVDGQPIVGDYLKMMFVEHKVVPTILDFFFRFPWNNFLHNVVYDVVQQVFNGPMDKGFNRSLAIDLFTTGRITDQIVEGQRRSDEAQKTKNMRLGYMGHLTLISEEVVKFSERHPPEVLSDAVTEKTASKSWTEYVENAFTETRERDAAILGGVRPDSNLGARQTVLNAVNQAQGLGNSVSTALANAGLGGSGASLDLVDLANNGNVSAGSHGNSLLSGFGSSSDEEDEELEEIGEQEDGSGDGGNGEQYPSYHPSSLSALSIFSPAINGPSTLVDETPNARDTEGSGIPPPIPPPLNIPPSRARRQLAARLALHGHTSPFGSPQDGSADAPESLDNHADSQPSELSPNKYTSMDSGAQQRLINNAIETNKSETPFGDLIDMPSNKDTSRDPAITVFTQGFDDDDEDDDDINHLDDGDEEGEIPITIAMPTRRLSSQLSPTKENLQQQDASREPSSEKGQDSGVESKSSPPPVSSTHQSSNSTAPINIPSSQTSQKSQQSSSLAHSPTTKTSGGRKTPRSPRSPQQEGGFASKMSELFSTGPNSNSSDEDDAEKEEADEESSNSSPESSNAAGEAKKQGSTGTKGEASAKAAV
ncbi:hypothetical protein MMC25_008336 [Agyrium rufum]|nr:hypothetical protein [Agyrium rufum]